MDKIVLQGGTPLTGEVLISGAKNAALPVLFSSILHKGVSRFSNVPHLADIVTTKKLLEAIGCKLTHEKDEIIIDATNIQSLTAPYDLVRTMRASCMMMGPLLARFGEAIISLPGGCAIGARPINLHLKGFEQLGATIEIAHGYIHAKAKKLKAATICFDTVTVTGTKNVLMAAIFAEGTSILENAAKEPELVNLAEILNKAGARIKGAGESVITIEGIPPSDLTPLEGAIIPDRIEAGTFMVAAAMTKGELLLKNCKASQMEINIAKMREMGARVKASENELLVSAQGLAKLKPVTLTTTPYPGFATDMQAQFMAAACIADGASVIHETVFENRFMHVAELSRMGAQIDIDGHTAIITGQRSLSGATVMATDLRASASLILAGLIAEGETEVRRIYHLDRGYEQMEEKLKKIGASICREKE